MNQYKKFQLYINGQFTDGVKQLSLQSINPATNTVWAEFACATTDDINHAVDSAANALKSNEWGQLTATQRGKLLYKLADLVEQNAAVLGEIETSDSGKLAVETVMQTRYVADYYRYYAGLADKIQGATLPIDKSDMHVYTLQEPIGIVVAIVPWNAQMFLTATKLAPALAAGCCVIIKASELAPCPILEFARLIDEAGFPAGVVSVVTGDVENCAIPLSSHPAIDRIAFTGGAETARHIIHNSTNNFAVTTLELGGKSPLIIFDDANIDSAVNGLIAGNFGASGQSCVAASRGLVHRSILPQIIERITQKSQSIVIGDPLDEKTHVGPLCTKAQIDCIEKTISQAKEQGATIHFGGTRANSMVNEKCKDGNFYSPTLVECPNTDIKTLHTEMFGPVMSLLAFDTEEQAIAIANNTSYGLGSGLFTQSLSRAHRVASKIRAGICWVNTYRAISPIAPFGGYNQSGYGRESGIDSIQDYIRSKTVWINTSDAPMANPFVMR